MKKALACLLAALLVCCCLSGCNGKPDDPSASASSPVDSASSAEPGGPEDPSSGTGTPGVPGEPDSPSDTPQTPNSPDTSSAPNPSVPDNSSNPPSPSSPEASSPSVPAPAFAFSAVTYPADAVKTLADRGISQTDFLRRAIGGSYTGNAGYSGSGIILSPYFTVSISGRAVPAYGTLTFIGSSQSGAIHSYSMINVNRDTFSLSVELTASGFTPAKAVVLPASLGVTPRVQGGKTSATITTCGTYTFLFNDGDQEHAYTLFVRRQTDEDAEIRQYQQQYGASKVKVFEPGVHYVDNLSIPSDDYTIYLKAGALLIANHKYDIDSDADNSSHRESGSIFGNRHPFISCQSKKNIRVIGQGTIDLSQLDWHERNGIVFMYTRQVTISGITLVNCPEWSLLQYRCTNVNIDQVAVFGYKTNSDGFAIANSQTVRVTNCFARSGDDLFEVKTLGGDAQAICKDVIFDNCIAWNGKARCFGITGEVNKDISDITFRNSAILYRDATWDNDRIGGLVIIPEQGGGKIRNVTFENIEIYRDTGRAINVTVYSPAVTNCTIEGVVFRNITCSSAMLSQLKSGSGSGNRIAVSFQNVTVNGTRVTTANSSSFLTKDANSSLTIS